MSPQNVPAPNTHKTWMRSGSGRSWLGRVKVCHALRSSPLPTAIGGKVPGAGKDVRPETLPAASAGGSFIADEGVDAAACSSAVQAAAAEVADTAEKRAESPGAVACASAGQAMLLTALLPFVPLTATATGRNVQGALNRTGERSRRPCIKSTAASTAARAPPLRRGMPGGYSGVAHPEDGASDRDVIDAAALAAAASSSADAAAVSAFLRWRWRWPWPRRLRPRPPPLTTTEALTPEAEAV